jgi:hypothetical protein
LLCFFAAAGCVFYSPLLLLSLLPLLWLLLQCYWGTILEHVVVYVEWASHWLPDDQQEQTGCKTKYNSIISRDASLCTKSCLPGELQAKQTRQLKQLLCANNLPNVTPPDTKSNSGVLCDL